ncbi:MAG: hypothetical protein ACTSRG_26640 [Candidatus Helarchaeota archaeon]
MSEEEEETGKTIRLYIRVNKEHFQIIQSLIPYYGDNNSEVIRKIIFDWFKSERVQKELKNLANWNLVKMQKLKQK